MADDSRAEQRRESTEAPEKQPGPIDKPSFDLNLSNQHFNEDFSKTNNRGNSAVLPEISLVNGDEKGKDATTKASGSDSLAAKNFKNIDGSEKFRKDTEEAFRESFGRLNPETQEKLRELKIVTASQVNKEIPGMQKNIPAVTPDKEEGHGNKMVFSEAGMKAQKAPIKDVMNHEIFHAVDNATGASKDPELRKAIDEGIKRLSKLDQKHITVHNKDEAEQRYAEFAGDIMALQMGSNKKDLAYVTNLPNPYDTFKEAREIIRRKYLRE